MTGLNETHDPARRSWVAAANEPASDFKIQNLPFGIFARKGEAPRGGIAIGDRILDLAAARDAGVFAGAASEAVAAAAEPVLNRFMGMGQPHWSALRRAVSDLLTDEARRGDGEKLLVAMTDARMSLPAAIANYTDFYASVFHATNVGKMFRPDQPLLPNYKYLPIGYHGRASSVIASGTEIRRPNGQTRPPDAAAPVFGPCRNLDYEMEVGVFVGPGNPLGTSVPIGAAAEHIFGFCLLNDWSARDIQAWEYQPLGPFLAKSFATTISPWVVTAEALAPFRTHAFRRPEGDPPPLPHLAAPEDQAAGGIDLVLDVWLSSARMREAGAAPIRLSRGNLRDAYWTVAQMLAHHTSNGCNLLPGDLFGTGTISGEARESWGSLLELTQRGASKIALPTGEERVFLADGDEVTMRARAEREGRVAIGFGECRGVVLPATGV